MACRSPGTSATAEVAPWVAAKVVLPLPPPRLDRHPVCADAGGRSARPTPKASRPPLAPVRAWAQVLVPPARAEATASRAGASRRSRRWAWSCHQRPVQLRLPELRQSEQAVPQRPAACPAMRRQAAALARALPQLTAISLRRGVLPPSPRRQSLERGARVWEECPGACGAERCYCQGPSPRQNAASWMAYDSLQPLQRRSQNASDPWGAAANAQLPCVWRSGWHAAAP